MTADDLVKSPPEAKLPQPEPVKGRERLTLFATGVLFGGAISAVGSFIFRDLFGRGR